tara:strand:+ start:581 stop:694 length:114 start_codon:yes stop_codon:yes gene_type:complete
MEVRRVKKILSAKPYQNLMDFKAFDKAQVVLKTWVWY